MSPFLFAARHSSEKGLSMLAAAGPNDRFAPVVRRLLAGLLLLVLASSAAFATADGADPLLEAPVIRMQPGAEYQDDVRAATMVIGMDQTPNGRIWGCWTGTGDNTESYFILATSDDGGTTWSKPRVVIDPVEVPGKPPRYSLIGNLWTDPSGKLWLFFDQHMKGAAPTGWYITCSNPDADTPTWSAPVLMGNGSTLNKPTVLQNGDWLLPVGLWFQGRPGLVRPTVASDDLDHVPMAHVYASTDQGKTWRRRGGAAVPAADVNFYEHMFVEREDGSLWMLMRTRNGIEECFSSDGGFTWTKPRVSEIKNPSTRFFIRRLASGRLLLVKNGPVDVRLRSRTHLTAFLSEDDGQTWKGGLLLDERGLVTYPDGFQSADGLIRILYDWNRHGEAEILFTDFREEDVLAGKLVSRDAKPHFIVDKARAPQFSGSTQPDARWTMLADADTKADFTSVLPGPKAGGVFSDTSLHEMTDGSWLLSLMSAGLEGKAFGHPSFARSADQGNTWTQPEAFELGLPRSSDSSGLGPVEVITQSHEPMMFFSTYGRDWPQHWRSWVVYGLPGATGAIAPKSIGSLERRTYLRNHLVTRAGHLLLPFQHYSEQSMPDSPPPNLALTHPRHGVLMSTDAGKTWTEQGNIRLTPINRQFDWEESNLVELGDDHIVMLIRASGLMALVYRADSYDGGKTWSNTAKLYRAPSPGSATFFGLGGNTVAMVHNPAAKLAMWVSFDGMKTWPYQRVLASTSTIGPKDNMRFPHGFVSRDKQWLHFAYIDRRERAVHYSAKLPAIPAL